VQELVVRGVAGAGEAENFVGVVFAVESAVGEVEAGAGAALELPVRIGTMASWASRAPALHQMPIGSTATPIGRPEAARPISSSRLAGGRDTVWRSKQARVKRL
jgi:hypothetical protein